MISRTFITFFIFISSETNAQYRWEFGYSFGGNATTARTIETDNNTAGYKTPFRITSWTNHWFLGYGNEKNKIYGVFDSGQLAGVSLK